MPLDARDLVRLVVGYIDAAHGPCCLGQIVQVGNDCHFVGNRDCTAERFGILNVVEKGAGRAFQGGTLAQLVPKTSEAKPMEYRIARQGGRGLGNRSLVKEEASLSKDCMPLWRRFTP